jgi:membrane protein required for colicin V production
MTIDIIYLILILAAIVKGIRRGMVVAVFSLAACIIGLAAAMKLSALLAVRLREHLHIPDRWLPLIAFILVFLAVIFLVRRLADLLQQGLQMVMLGWLNRLGAILLYAVLYTAIFSVLLFYGTQTGIISQESRNSSLVYSFVEPWGPGVINRFAHLVPWFRDMFTQLSDFFARVGKSA